MKALVSKIEHRNTGYRVAQVEIDADVFDVSDDFEWITCPDDIVADQYWYDQKNNSFKKNVITEVKSNKQPITVGAQTL